MNQKISVVIGSYNRLPLLKKTILSVRNELASTNHEIIVIDGGSYDGSMRWLSKQKDIITIIQHNHGTINGKRVERRSWGYFMNLGFKCAQGKYVCMISDDCLVVPNAILNGIKLAEEKIANGEKIGAVAFYWREFTSPRYMVSLTFGRKIYVNHGLYLKKALEDVGYISENDFLFYHGDEDLCLKMWNKGYKCIDSPESFIEHCPHTNLLQKKANAVGQTNDHKKLVEKWNGSYDEINGNYLYMDHIDKYGTYKMFEKMWYTKTYKIINAIGLKTKRLARKWAGK